MERVFTYIVDKHIDRRLAGARPSEWLKRAFENAPHLVVESEKGAGLPAGADYVAVIPSTMPLVTPSDLAEVVREMERRAIAALEIGEGNIAAASAIKEGAAPKGILRTDAFLSVDRAENIAKIERALYRRNACISVQNGANIPDVDNVRIDFMSRVSYGATVSPFTVINASEIGEGAVIGPFSVIERSRVAAGAVVTQSVVQDSVVGKGATVGPFAYIRMGSAIGDKCRIGDFVEVKKSLIADGAKAAHLTYIGDAEIGLGTNVGCGTVFANYDGVEKHKTKVGDHVFIGANTNLVAPVTVGDGAYIAAATTVTRDVPENSFVIGRSRAETKERKRKC